MKVKVCVLRETEPDFLSRVVHFGIQRPYTHICIKYQGMMYHLVPEGLRVDDYEDYMVGHELMGEKEVELFCTPKIFHQHFEFYASTMSVEYSYAQVLGYIPILGRLFLNGRARGWCSEYVAWVLNDLGRRWDMAEGDLSTPTLFEDI